MRNAIVKYIFDLRLLSVEGDEARNYEYKTKGIAPRCLCQCEQFGSIGVIRTGELLFTPQNNAVLQ